MAASVRAALCFSNLALATALCTLWGVAVYTSDGEVVDRLFFSAATLILVVNTLRRPPATAEDSRWWVWIVCAISLLYFLGFETATSHYGGGSVAAKWTIIFCHILGDVCLIGLGKSFAILPARREIRIGFLYRWVRHPVYALYILADVCFVACVPTPRNILLFVIGAATYVVRANLEERLLENDESYHLYKVKTRFRFFPKIY